MTLKADLHMHSTCSDGLLSPSELVEHAKERGVDIIALTDHDTVEGVQEAIEHGKTHDIRVIPGIELSTTYNNENIHILGYFKDHQYKSIELRAFLSDLKEKRYSRAKRIVDNLKTLHNIEISFDSIVKNSDGVIARPHIAREILKVCPNLSWDDIFSKYLKDGAPAYIPSVKVPLEDGINLLKKYNALIFLAHPTIIKKTPVQDFLQFNLDGMECIYPENKKGQTKRFKEICRKGNIITSAGSDFHGALVLDTTHHDIGTVFLEGDELNTFLMALEKR